MARMKNGKWSAQELLIKGAVGFYTQVLSVKDNLLTIALHNFRSDYFNEDSTFEDLAVAKIRLD